MLRVFFSAGCSWLVSSNQFQSESAKTQGNQRRKPGYVNEKLSSFPPPIASSLLIKDNVCYDGSSPYEVADMLKEYFRDLPERLLTNKLSESLILIVACKNIRPTQI